MEEASFPLRFLMEASTAWKIVNGVDMSRSPMVMRNHRKPSLDWSGSLFSSQPKVNDKMARTSNTTCKIANRVRLPSARNHCIRRHNITPRAGRKALQDSRTGRCVGGEACVAPRRGRGGPRSAVSLRRGEAHKLAYGASRVAARRIAQGT